MWPILILIVLAKSLLIFFFPSNHIDKYRHLVTRDFLIHFLFWALSANEVNSAIRVTCITQPQVEGASCGILIEQTLYFIMIIIKYMAVWTVQICYVNEAPYLPLALVLVAWRRFRRHEGPRGNVPPLRISNKMEEKKRKGEWERNVKMSKEAR